MRLSSKLLTRPRKFDLLARRLAGLDIQDLFKMRDALEVLKGYGLEDRLLIQEINAQLEIKAS
jgi:hypothetical protein